MKLLNDRFVQFYFNEGEEMKMSIEHLPSRWRTGVTTAFVLIAFAAPSSKGIFGKIFNVYATGGTSPANNGYSGNYSSAGPPASHEVAGPDSPSSRYHQPNAH